MSTERPPNARRGTAGSVAGWTLRLVGQTLSLLGRMTTAVDRVLTAAGRSTTAAGRALSEGSAESSLDAGPSADEWSPTGGASDARRAAVADHHRSVPRSR